MMDEKKNKKIEKNEAKIPEKAIEKAKELTDEEAKEVAGGAGFDRIGSIGCVPKTSYGSYFPNSIE